MDTNGAQLVLVVDDDDAVRNVTMRALERFGFATLAARDGMEAVSTYEQRRDEIDCVILDMSMPGMDGEQTMEALQRSELRAPVLLASGHSTEEMRLAHASAGFAGFLQKPYQIMALADVVRETIAWAGR